MTPIRAGVWGVGVWGEKHARVYHALPEAELVGVFDQDPARAREVAARHDARVFDSAAALLEACEAVSIAVPTIHHRAAVEQAAAAQRHILVEKPMAVTVAEADAMIAAAERAGVVLQVGQLERFNPALLAVRPLVTAPKFIEAHRLALFQPRSLDIDVVFDLMIHDLDLVLQAVGTRPTSISAVGVAVLSSNEDIANARLEFADGCVANLTASRVSQERLRRIRFFQSDSYLAIDLLDKTAEMLKLDVSKFRPEAPHEAIRQGRLEVGAGEPLTLELAAFLRSLAGAGAGAASAADGREALRVAEEVRAGMKRRASQWAISASGVS
jgi:predicted dehydrogenase